MKPWCYKHQFALFMGESERAWIKFKRLYPLVRSLDPHLFLDATWREGASIYDVRAEGRRGPRNTPNLRTNSISLADKKGVKKCIKYVDVIYGSPLTAAAMTAWQLIHMGRWCCCWRQYCTLKMGKRDITNDFGADNAATTWNFYPGWREIVSNFAHYSSGKPLKVSCSEHESWHVTSPDLLLFFSRLLSLCQAVWNNKQMCARFTHHHWWID